MEDENKKNIEEEIFEDDYDIIEEEKVEYSSPTEFKEDVLIDGDGKSFSELPNLEKIKMASLQYGVETLEPNSNCKDCLGKGYVSVRIIKTSGTNGDLIEELPNPCRCIYRKEDRMKMFSGKIMLYGKERKRYEARELKDSKKIPHSLNVAMQRKKAELKKQKKAKRKMKKRHNK